MSWYSHPLIICAAVLGLTLAGCEPPSERDQRVAKGERNADTAQLAIVARYPLPPSRSDTIPLRITALTVGADHRVYVAAADGVLYSLDSHGMLQPVFRLISKPVVPTTGVRALIVPDDGSVLARDGRGGVHVYTRAGVRTATWRLGPAQSLWAPQLLAPSTQGIRVGIESSRTQASDETVALAALLASAGRLSDTLRLARAQYSDCFADAQTHFRSGSFDDIRTRYTPSLQWAPLRSGGFVAGCNAGYQFTIVHADGRVVRVHQQRALVAVSAEEQRSFVAAWTLRMRNGGGGADWQWQGKGLPGHKPAYQRILTTSDDRIWVWSAQPSQAVPAPPQWVFVGGPRTLYVEPTAGAFDVFSPDGQYIGAVAIPSEPGFAPFGVSPAPVIQGDTAWFVATDTSGANAVVRTHIRWPRSSLRAAARGATGAHVRLKSGRSR